MPPRGSSEAALSLTNADGPSLYLNPLDADWNDPLQPGQIANTTRGPLIGIVQGGENRNAALLTDQDVWIPFVLPQPLRLVDTRTVLGRERVTLPSPLTGDGRLPAGKEMTFWISPADEGFGIPAVQLNITVVKPSSAGYVVAYPGPDRPDDLDGELPQKRTVANGAFSRTSVGSYRVNVGPGQPPEVHEAIVVKIYTSATAWIVVDGTGGYATGFDPITGPGGNLANRPGNVARPPPWPSGHSANCGSPGLRRKKNGDQMLGGSSDRRSKASLHPVRQFCLTEDCPVPDNVQYRTKSAIRCIDG